MDLLFGLVRLFSYAVGSVVENVARAVGTVQMVRRVREWPGPVPHTQYCMVHREQEENIGAYTDCQECGHVYQTYEALREEHRLLYARIGGSSRAIGIISYCPLCLHDF